MALKVTVCVCVCVCTTGASGGADSAGPSGTQRDDPMDPLAEETRKMHGTCCVVCVIPSLCLCSHARG